MHTRMHTYIMYAWVDGGSSLKWEWRVADSHTRPAGRPVHAFIQLVRRPSFPQHTHAHRNMCARTYLFTTRIITRPHGDTHVYTPSPHTHMHIHTRTHANVRTHTHTHA
eukprot:GHVU01071002.1.p1 GENE.GHVU01071002.1~~GHVU01071002.1.p1  ORF type:complete len:109 (-),score=0.80 GHVU01071002.1:15-341(-)